MKQASAQTDSAAIRIVHAMYFDLRNLRNLWIKPFTFSFRLFGVFRGLSFLRRGIDVLKAAFKDAADGVHIGLNRLL